MIPQSCQGPCATAVMQPSKVGDPQLLIPDLCRTRSLGFDVDHMWAHNSVIVELTRGHIQCLYLGAPWAGVKGWLWGILPPTPQWLLCGTSVGSSPKRASFCFPAPAITPERKSSKVRCGTRTPFALWQHKGTCLCFGISVFWRAFARQWTHKRQCKW